MSKKLLQLLSQNATQARAPKLVMGYDPDADGDSDAGMGGDDDNDATLWLYDAIGGWDGIDAQDMAKNIAGMKAKTLHLRINSPGGDVFEARAISTALAAFSGKVVAHIDGLAASSASFIMLAADEIEMSPGSFVMIHNPWGFALGDAAEMRATAGLLDQVKAAIVDDYQARTGMDASILSKMMDDETWMDAETALKNKFVDKISTRKSKASARAFNLSAFNAVPDALKAPPAPHVDEELAAARVRAETRLRLYERAA